MPTQTTALYFDGYCPESKLKGKIVEMKLNADDFWESPATGLQITTFTPYAAILRWRGEGKFRSSSPSAGVLYEKGLVLTQASKELGKEIFPDPTAVINTVDELKSYLSCVS